MNTIAVAIITKEREEKIVRCLLSLQNQTIQPQEILIIDTAKNPRLKKVILSLNSSIPIKYLHSPLSNVAVARNIAINTAKTTLLCFIDDDCILKKNYIKKALEYFDNVPVKLSVTYLVGKSKDYKSTSLAAKAEFVFSNYWYDQKIQTTYPYLTPFNFDTKNVVLLLKVFKQHNVLFPEQFQLRGYDSSDTALGFILHSLNIKGIQLKDMILWHDDGVNVRQLLSKQFFKGIIANKIAIFWNKPEEFVDLHFSFRKIMSWKAEFLLYFKNPIIPRLTAVDKVVLFTIIKMRVWSFTLGYWLATKYPKLMSGM